MQKKQNQTSVSKKLRVGRESLERRRELTKEELPTVVGGACTTPQCLVPPE